MNGDDVEREHEGQDRAETAAFIVPPPGLVPNAPATAPPNTTERPRSRPVERSLPAFAPVAVPGLPAAPPAPPAPPAALPVTTVEWRLSDEGGIDIRLKSRALLGRAPDASAFPGCVRVAIGDPERTVSKTHALVEPSGDVLLVTDLRSTNGVRIERDGAVAHELPPGASAHLTPGDVLVLGEFRLSVTTV